MGGSCSVADSVAIDPSGRDDRSWFPDEDGLGFPTRIADAVPIRFEVVDITAPRANNFIS
jgi:hypothetical protein